jgi:hypothetical protein
MLIKKQRLKKIEWACEGRMVERALKEVFLKAVKN